MTIQAFTGRLPDGRDVAYLLAGREEIAPGDYEGDFLAELSPVSRINTRSLSEAITSLAERARSSAGYPLTAIIVVSNPSVVLDDEFKDRVAGAISLTGTLNSQSIESAPLWSLIAPEGITPEGQQVSTVYASKEPALPLSGAPRPLLTPGEDVFILNPALLDNVLLRSVGEMPLAAALATAGWLLGSIALFTPGFTVGIDGKRLEIDTPDPDALLETAAMMTGRDAHDVQATIDEARHAAILRQSAPMSVSIVTRTMFTRPYLLRRLLTSVTRGRTEDVAVEVILSTTAERGLAEAEFAQLKKEFPALDLALSVNGEPDTESRTPLEHSRVLNLLEGFKTARHDYVAVVDDDDFVSIQVMPHLATARFMGGLPILTVDTKLQHEQWDEGHEDRWVMSSVRSGTTYPGRGWTNMFCGYNRLPICAMLLPRDWLNRRLSQFSFRYDLSEDYAMFLLLLLAPDLPEVTDLNQVFCYVSVREDGTNTITMENRRPWVADISRYLGDLAAEDGPASAGVLRLMSALTQSEHKGKTPGATRAQDEISRQRNEIKEMRREIRVLRTRLHAELAEGQGSVIARPLPEVVVPTAETAPERSPVSLRSPRQIIARAREIGFNWELVTRGMHKLRQSWMNR